MLTREQIFEIDSYCAEHKIRQVDRLAELEIPLHQFYRWKRKYRNSTWKFGSDNILRVQIYYTGTERGFTYEFSYEVFPIKKAMRISMPWDDGITTYGDYSINECTSKKMRLVLTSSYETEEKEGYFYKEVLLNKIK